MEFADGGTLEDLIADYEENKVQEAGRRSYQADSRRHSGEVGIRRDSHT